MTAAPAASADTVTLAGAVNRALGDAMAEDDRVYLMGEDIGRLGGVFRVTDGLQKRFGSDRVLDTPISEAGIVGAAVGMCMEGLRPIVELQFDAFGYPAYEQIFGHVAKMANRTRGRLPMPMVIRVPYGGGIGGVEHHSDSSEAYYTHTAGLVVVAPSNPADAYALLRASIEADDPVVFLEPKRHYWDKGPLTGETVPLGRAAVVRPGTTATLLAYGQSVAVALAAAELGTEEHLDLEVIDLRTLSPFDDATVTASVRRTGRAVVIHEAQQFGGYGAEVAARVTEACFVDLEAPVQRVTGLDMPYPAPKLEHWFLPDPQRVLDAVARTGDYL